MVEVNYSIKMVHITQVSLKIITSKEEELYSILMENQLI